MKMKAVAFLLVAAVFSANQCGHHENLFSGTQACDLHCSKNQVCVAAWTYTGDDLSCKKFSERTSTNCGNESSDSKLICKCLPTQTSFAFNWTSTKNDWSKCKKNKKCADGQGDCDEDYQCGVGLFCNYNSGTVVWPRYIHDKETLSGNAKGVDYCTRQILVDLKRDCRLHKCGFEVTGTCTDTCPDDQMVCKNMQYSKNYSRDGVYDMPEKIPAGTKICQFKITEIKHHKARISKSDLSNCAGNGCKDGEGNCTKDSDCEGASTGLERIYCNLRTDGSSNLWYSQKLGTVEGQGLDNVGFCTPEKDVGSICADAGKADGHDYVAAEDDKACTSGSYKVKLEDCKASCKNLKHCNLYGWKGRNGDDGKDFCYLMNGCTKRSTSEYKFYHYVEDNFGYCVKEKMWTKSQGSVKCGNDSTELKNFVSSSIADCGDKIAKDSSCSGVMVFDSKSYACACVKTAFSCKLQRAGSSSIVYITKKKIYEPLEKYCTNPVVHSKKQEDYISGEKYTITCDKDYSLDNIGTTSLPSKCSNGNWNPPLTEDLCKKSCTAETIEPKNGNSLPQKFFASGASVTISCNEAISSLKGSSTATCSDGTWNYVTKPSCPQNCLVNLQNAASASVNPFASGASTEVSCAKGFHFSSEKDTETSTCNNGTWSPAFSTCEKNICKCSHGTGATGVDCERHGSDKCAGCFKGHHLVNHACPENICKCEHGTPATGTNCAKVDESWKAYPKCTACINTTNFTLIGGKCLESCTAETIEPKNGNSLPQRVFASGASVTISCNEAISSLEGSSTATCSDGTWNYVTKPSCPLDPLCSAKPEWNHKCPTNSDNISYFFKTVCNGKFEIRYKTTEKSFQEKCCEENVGEKSCEAVRRRMMEKDQASTLEKISNVQKIIDHVYQI